jgi:hypothetical protein
MSDAFDELRRCLAAEGPPNPTKAPQSGLDRIHEIKHESLNEIAEQ